MVIPLPKKLNLRLCKNYRTISLISHPSMLRIILNRLKGKSGEMLAEEQAGFRGRRSTTEQIFNVRVIIYIGGRPICNFRFADDIDLVGGSESEHQDLIPDRRKRQELMAWKSAQRKPK